MEPERSGSVQSRNAAPPQIRFHEGAGDRLGHGEEPPRGFWRSGRNRRRAGARRTLFWLRSGHGQKGSCLVGDGLEVDEPHALANDVEQVAMLAGGCVGPLAGRSLRRVPEPDEHRTARRVANITDLPVLARAPSVREVVPAHRLGMFAESVGEFGGIVAWHHRHHAVSRSLTRATGQRPSTRSSTAMPPVSIGTNILSFHEMISWKSP